jgi:AraC-like DNA-binding protein
MSKKKTKHFTEDEFTDLMSEYFNDGRANADRKWIEAIDERIAELEKLVGIPELRKLREKVRYRWDEKPIKKRMVRR